MVIAMVRRRQPSDKPVHPLRQWRERHGWSQPQVAEYLGVTQGMVSHYELYIRQPRLDVLRKLCELTGLSADAFIEPERFVREHPDFLRPRRRRRQDKEDRDE
jgi:transcriptional regulator with XRE-family HTH domain